MKKCVVTCIETVNQDGNAIVIRAYLNNHFVCYYEAKREDKLRKSGVMRERRNAMIKYNFFLVFVKNFSFLEYWAKKRTVVLSAEIQHCKDNFVKAHIIYDCHKIYSQKLEFIKPETLEEAEILSAFASTNPIWYELGARKASDFEVKVMLK